MDQDLLPYLLAAFPTTARPGTRPDSDELIIRGYRIAADAVDGRLLALLQGQPAERDAQAA